MAGLRFVGTNADMLGVTFQREGVRTSTRGLRHMRRVANQVMKKSIENSPVDWHGPGGGPPGHELEEAHKIVEARGGSDRIEATVEVGGNVGGVNVDLYAEYQHNGGDGSNQRGPGTIAKGPQAGPFFLERALQESENEFDDLLDELFEGLMG